MGADEELGGAPKRRVRNPDLKKHDNHDHGESIKREKQKQKKKKKKKKDELKRRAQD